MFGRTTFSRVIMCVVVLYEAIERKLMLLMGVDCDLIKTRYTRVNTLTQRKGLILFADYSDSFKHSVVTI